MSWRAVRYERNRGSFKSRRQVNNNVRSKRATKLRADDQQMVTRLTMEANEVVSSGTLENIFGSSSAAYALRVAVRIKRAKRRNTALLTSGDFSEGAKIKARRHLRGRNIHHMTPKSRKGQLFSGDGTCNLLLMKVPRHDLLHKEFGVRTWEEIIVLLAQCVKIAWHVSFSEMIDSHIPPLPRKKMCRRMARRSLHNLQWFGESPGYSGLFIIDAALDLIV